MNKFTATKDVAGDGGVIDFKRALKGVLKAYILSVILLAVSSVLLTYSLLPDFLADFTVKTVVAISVMFAALKSAKHFKMQGWLGGLSIGLLYTALLYIAGSLITTNFAVTNNTAITAAIALSFGALGGIWGANKNIKHKKRRR